MADGEDHRVRLNILLMALCILIGDAVYRAVGSDDAQKPA